ncbi:hypothetical protein V8D89_000269 [Ganoderma adspersum]
MTQIFVDKLRDNPRLENSKLDEDAISRLLRDPLTVPAMLTTDERLSVKLFLADTDGSEKIYNESRKAILERHPDDDILSHHSVKKKIAELTGIHPLTHNMCPKSCMAYTGPWEDLDTCKFCSEPRYDQDLLARSKPIKKAQRTFDTYPVGPQVQACFRSPDGARDMRYRQSQMDRIMCELDKNGELDRITDIIEGSDFWDACQHERISENNLCLLYEHKALNVWIYIWILRYKKQFILPGAIIPGPTKPKHSDSFLFPGFHHIAALQRTGYISRPWIVLGEADAVGAPDQTGYVTHHGKMGCRYRCGRSHYYPVGIKPRGYYEQGCLHDDYDPYTILLSSAAQYQADLAFLRGATSETNYHARRLKTGLSRPSLFSGLSPTHMLPIPHLFPGDIMHLFGLNIPDLLYSLWHGTIDCDTKNGDNKASWDWVCLVDDVAAARHYLPGSFDHKISSGYKCWEFLNWFYGLAPAMLYQKLPDIYWMNYCKLWDAHLLLCTFVDEYERIYVQGQISWMHFVPQCIHATVRIGSLICTSQFTMERIIGDLGGEIRHPSNPYANLSERALRRARRDTTPTKVPREDLGDGFILLHPREDRPRAVADHEDMAIFRYLEARVGMVRARAVWIDTMHHRVRRWARCRLPNSQVCRSAWKEVQNSMTRISRNIKV